MIIDNQRWTQAGRRSYEYCGTVAQWRYALDVERGWDRDHAFYVAPAVMFWPATRRGWEDYGFIGFASRTEVLDTFLRDDV